MDTDTTRMAVLASGDGTNLEAIARSCEQGQLAASIELVLCNVPQAGVLGRARALGLATRCIDHREFDSRELFDQALINTLRAARVEFVVLAGFMRLLSAAFVRNYYGRLLNIHPSLLPKYPGLNTHQRALEAGDRLTGSTVHFVTDDLDAGPPVMQVKVPIVAGDTVETLKQRVKAQEHRLYPAAISRCLSGVASIEEPNSVFLEELRLDSK
ncbi:MAG: phosphoribosylglycinamide formyltransferase [Pseudomonadota bacterium]